MKHQWRIKAPRSSPRLYSSFDNAGVSSQEIFTDKDDSDSEEQLNEDETDFSDDDTFCIDIRYRIMPFRPFNGTPETQYCVQQALTRYILKINKMSVAELAKLALI